MNLRFFKIFILFFVTSTPFSWAQLDEQSSNKIIKIRKSKKNNTASKSFKTSHWYAFHDSWYKSEKMFFFAGFSGRAQRTSFEEIDLLNQPIYMNRASTIDINSLKKLEDSLELSILNHIVEKLEVTNYNYDNLDNITTDDLIEISESFFSGSDFGFSTSYKNQAYPFWVNFDYTSNIIRIRKYQKFTINFQDALSKTETEHVELTPFINVEESIDEYTITFFLLFAKNNEHLYSELFKLYFIKDEVDLKTNMVNKILPVLDLAMNGTLKRINRL